ncbi:uncharacterized protein LOC136042185 isoform X2 [Artemia franciscana]|uniref:Gamma-aminobutyric acid type B receptor subunit 2 n=1 Tax=Artemia franciscana TaxID=6661 RepID=A0AA88KU00_ARTSF|nr:hypothetical protein QYM36_018418 [Artemia franciscana]
MHEGLKEHSLRMRKLFTVIIWRFLFLLVTTSALLESSCIRSQTDVLSMSRSLVWCDQKRTIMLETSDRVTHQLATHAFAIFVRDVLGYEDVAILRESLNSFNKTTVLERLAGLETEIEDFHEDIEECNEKLLPISMVNLEVWVSPGISESLTIDGYVDDLGPLGPGGRFGWFLPADFVETFPIIGHWRGFLDRDIVASLDLNELEMEELRYFMRNNETEKYECQEQTCQDGMFIPPQCKKNDNELEAPPCAILFAENLDYTYFLKRQIVEMHLLVKVAWFDSDVIERAIEHFLTSKTRNSSGQSIVYFAWKPSTVSESGDFVSVSFPPCEDLIDDSDPRCAYEIQRFEKFSWAHLKDGAKVLFEAVQNVYFHQSDYGRLLNLYNRRRGQDISKIACEWLNNEGQELWKHWIPEIARQKPEIEIGGIFPITGDGYTAAGLVPAARLAIEAINNDGNILTNYKLVLHTADGRCTPDIVMKSFIEYTRMKSFNRLAGILGPACSNTVEPIAGVAKHFRTVVISYSAEGSFFSDRDKYPYFFRTIGENRQYKYVYTQLFLQLGWKRIVSMTEDGQKYGEYISSLRDVLKPNGITFIENRKFPQNSEPTKIRTYLRELKDKHSRILIGEFYDHWARSVMCEAYHEGMTAKNGFVWFLPTWYRKDWYKTEHRNGEVQCTTEQMLEAIDGHLGLSYSNFAGDGAIMQENIPVGEWRRKYEDLCARHGFNSQDYAGFVYDAIWMYAYALDKLLLDTLHSADFHSVKTAEALVRILNETDFYGVSGRVRFLGSSSRLSDVINVLQFNNETYNVVGVFRPNFSAHFKDSEMSLKYGKLELNNDRFIWLTEDGAIPDDGSSIINACLIAPFANSLNLECEYAIVVANVIGFGAILLIVIIFGLIYKNRYDKDIKEREERMKALGLLEESKMLTLDEWEFPREQVVINRKIGEGAFGTVYGGEAFFSDKGWVAVAVKTLKMGSTVEEKLDFLSEAEMMKRFEHKNIVKLLGVCTRNEPVYTIMEFMLYGDLKTYLLARRHLVNEKNREENDEVSSRRLTAMALDVARGLSYLAELKYVHRDVACRNCLVNSNRVVKLADFGMTRPMYENDYYRFRRKGMLPVRWMAPESLADGLFTPMTDVWSYGVLLYEIITFGGFPFQGLSNSQVLEHVKNGHTLPIPAGVKTQLETLLKSCWNRTPSLRPQASEIVELLANNQRLIQPCLGIPMSSVQIEGTNSLELHLDRRLRNNSFVTRRKSTSIETSVVYTDNNGHTVEVDVAGDTYFNANSNGSAVEPLLRNIGATYTPQYITLQHTPRGDLELDCLSDGSQQVTPV